MIELLGLQMQPGYLVIAAATTGVTYGLYRIVKSNRALKKERGNLKKRQEPTLSEAWPAGRSVTAEDQLRREAELRGHESARKAQRDRIAGEQSRDVRKARTEATRSGGTGRRAEDFSLSHPNHPANPVNQIHTADTDCRGDSDYRPSSSRPCSSSSSSHSYSDSSSSSSSSSDSSSCGSPSSCD